MSPDISITRLSGWDQVAMRSYMSKVLCFPFDNTKIDAATAHIEASLAQLALHRPDFAGTLEVHEGGIVHHVTNKDNTIPFFVEDISSDFPFKSYDELKAADFPPGAFVHPRFMVPCQLTEGGPGVPVLILKAFIIPGGLFLGTYFCHAFADGGCLKIFLETFSSLTRGILVEGAKTKRIEAPFANESNVKDGKEGRLDTLLAKVPEYTVLDTPTGPTTPQFRPDGVPMEDIEKIGKIFVFDNERLKELRCSVLGASTAAMSEDAGHAVSIPTLPSNYSCLAALTWAHISKARLSDPVKYVPYTQGVDDIALLQTMVNWKSRALVETNPDYFGNATAIAATRLPTKDSILSRASESPLDLSKLIFAIETTISRVDDEFVCDRTELFSRVSDPRLVGLRFDPRTPQDLGFNTWRFFGADTEWEIPGVGDAFCAAKPDVIRRVQMMWNMSGALILPAKATSTTHELLVTLPRSSMDLLCNDADWMKWVDHVIG
ncbi:hypothetical protein SBRCBS47491_008533 [Sporothrix bragantina]|uniref:Trichothecene 3-O-acetyltransferase n=1 Tax=Sporothrix bragantina TaxID=671064 RepID=A0ABP0CM92_9PEZI